MTQTFLGEKKTTVINQCTYLPWIGFFERLKRADVFVFLDDVQYQRREWQNRNRIKSSSGEYLLLTVPVRAKGMYHELIKNIQIDYSTDWVSQHLESIRHAYRKAPFFNEVFPRISKILENHYEFLADLNKQLIRDFADYLKLYPRFVSSSELGTVSNKVDRLIEICKAVKGNFYYSSCGSKNYMLPEEYKFAEAGIGVGYQEYFHPIYPQMGKRFLSYLSVVDLLFNVGPRACDFLDGQKESVLQSIRRAEPVSKKGLVFRVDAGPQIGLGHMMRCFALAQASRDFGYTPVFAVRSGAESIRQRFEKEDFAVCAISPDLPQAQEAAEILDIARANSAEWIVLDGYHFTSEIQQAIKNIGLKLFLIDDLGECSHYWADIVLNQNIFACEEMYRSREPLTRCLLGLKYVMLRKEFLREVLAKRTSDLNPVRLLVTLGGADATNATAKVIDALKEIRAPKLEVLVIIGNYNKHQAEIQKKVDAAGPAFRIEKSPQEMAKWIMWADLAVSASGSTCWEILHLGLPAIVLSLSLHQNWIAVPLEQLGALVNLGPAEKVTVRDIQEVVDRLLSSPQARESMSRAGRELIDGKGVQRVMCAIACNGLSIRKATLNDASIIWKWVNEPDVRAASFSPGPITWEAHLGWLEDRVKNPGCFVYIGLAEDSKPFGCVRYETSAGQTSVSIVIDEKFRGKGCGVGLLTLSAEQFFANSTESLVHARIKRINHASVRVFSKAGYKLAGISQSEWGYEELDLTLQRTDL